MAFSAPLSHHYHHHQASLSTFSANTRKPPTRLPFIRAVNSSSENETTTDQQKPTTKPPPKPTKPVYSMKKGQIVRVEKDKYLNSINYLSVGHPPYYKGLDYIYEDRGEIAWVGIPTAPAWLPTEMLIKSDKLDYERI